MNRLYLIVALILTLSCNSSLSATLDDDKDVVFVAESEESIRFIYRSIRASYHCDFVRAETAAILRRLGAANIQVSCRGGRPYNGTNEVEASFISLRETERDKSTKRAYLADIKFRFNQSCDLHRALMSHLLIGFDIYDFYEEGYCSRSHGRLLYSMKILK